MPLPDLMLPLVDKPVAVFGGGLSGRGVVALLESYGIDSVIYDEKGISGGLTQFLQDHAAGHDLVVYSPGFHARHPWLELAHSCGCNLLGELDFASLFWGGNLIAVTGTNGKTTLTEFLTAALQQQGIVAAAVGNIGYPLSQFVLDNLSDVGCVVCEVSSFQAESIHYLRPDALLWTNITEDHLDRYADFSEYFSAKWNLVQRSSKIIVGQSVAEWAERLGKRLPAITDIVNADTGKVPNGSCFAAYPQRENYCLAEKYWQIEGYDSAVLAAAARTFVRSKHRLELVIKQGDISFWNDSKSTNFAATLAALQTFDEPVYWIGGGKLKGGDMRQFVEKLNQKINAAFLIGESAVDLQAYLEEYGVFVMTCSSLEEALAVALKHVFGKAAIVLSPGFSSQDMFADYVERGLRFEKAVMNYVEDGKKASGIN